MNEIYCPLICIERIRDREKMRDNCPIGDIIAKAKKSLLIHMVHGTKRMGGTAGISNTTYYQNCVKEGAMHKIIYCDAGTKKSQSGKDLRRIETSYRNRHIQKGFDIITLNSHGNQLTIACEMENGEYFRPAETNRLGKWLYEDEYFPIITTMKNLTTKNGSIHLLGCETYRKEEGCIVQEIANYTKKDTYGFRNITYTDNETNRSDCYHILQGKIVPYQKARKKRNGNMLTIISGIGSIGAYLMDGRESRIIMVIFYISGYIAEKNSGGRIRYTKDKGPRFLINRTALHKKTPETTTQNT